MYMYVCMFVRACVRVHGSVCAYVHACVRNTDTGRHVYMDNHGIYK